MTRYIFFDGFRSVRFYFIDGKNKKFDPIKHPKDDDTGKFCKKDAGNISSSSIKTPIQVKNSKTTAINIGNKKVQKAYEKILAGSSAETITNLRPELSKYGASTDVYIFKGNKKFGLEHIRARHGDDAVVGVLDALADGKIIHYEPAKQTLFIEKNGYEACLSLNYFGKTLTWLLTGYDLSGQINPRKVNNPNPR